jgi:hypothetical protein
MSSSSGTRYLDVNVPAGQSTRMEVGVLYNFNAIVNQSSTQGVAMTDLQDMLSPSGWRVPLKAQLDILRNYASQSTLATVNIPELDDAGAGVFGNATGFSMKGNQQRGQNGGWNNGTHLGSMDYRFDGSQSNAYLHHGYYCLRMVAGSDFNLGTGASVQGNNYFAGRAANYVRCIRD